MTALATKSAQKGFRSYNIIYLIRFDKISIKKKIKKTSIAMWTVRLSGFPHTAGANVLQSSMENFGEVVHVNLSRYGSETIVIFSSQQAAEAAGNYLTEKGFQAIPGVQEILDARQNSRQTLVFERMSHEISAPFSASDDVGGHEGHYWPNLMNLVNSMDGVFEDESYLRTAKAAMEDLANQNASQQNVARLLLEIGERLKNEKRAVSDPAALDMWLVTMRFFADGQLSQHCDRFADTSVNELLGCLDENCGALADAWAETE